MTAHSYQPGGGRQMFVRDPANPILQARDWPVPVNVVFNPAAARTADGTILLVRAEDRRGLSSLYVARSNDGVHDWTIDARPAMEPIDGDHHAAWGFEDPRMVWVEELQMFAITCTAYGPGGPSVHLALTPDFEEFEHIGAILPPDDKNATLLPRRINGHWVLLHRPTATSVVKSPDIWLSRSSDLMGWRAPEHVMSCRKGGWWDMARIGAGPPPIETSEGWLLLYHGVKQTVTGSIYRVGAALLDLEHPQQVLRRSSDWLMSPEAPYERIGDVANTVFPCGAVVEGDTVRIYYGGADTCVCTATASIREILDSLDPVDPLATVSDTR